MHDRKVSRSAGKWVLGIHTIMLCLLLILLTLPASSIEHTVLSDFGMKKIHKEKFVVIYDNLDEELAKYTCNILQNASEELEERLSLGEKPVTVIICSTVEQFKKFAGRYARSNVGGIAKSNQGLIVLKAPRLQINGGDYTGTLRHELIHVLLARNTNMANVPRWLNEGIAMSFSAEYRWMSKYRVGKMYLQGRIIDYRDLEFTFTEPGNEMEFGDAYAQALSMTKYLMTTLENNQFWEMVNMMKSTSFEKALEAKAGMSALTLYVSWKKSLWKVAIMSSTVSGFTAFQVAAILTLVAFIKRRRRGKLIMKRWEEEEENDPPVFTVYDLEDQEVYEWEEDE